MWQQADVLSSVIRLFTGLDVATIRCTEQFATRLFTGLDVATVRYTEQFAIRLFTGLDVATVRCTKQFASPVSLQQVPGARSVCRFVRVPCSTPKQ